uniref:ING domain-containing protein n=1 Tax=Heterorhabditis bacteriophora TaxID=37862 RepID=A0A1I7WJH0_HETBA
MIVEQIELKEDYNELKTFLAEVHKYVHTEIEDPPEGSKALDHFKQKRVEYKKYLLTMNNFAETLKSSSESLKKSVTEIIKISPDSYVDIQKQDNEFLKECPYPKLVVPLKGQYFRFTVYL